MDRNNRLRCSSETEDGFGNSAIMIYLFIYFFIRKNLHSHIGKNCENNLEIHTVHINDIKVEIIEKGTGII